jgi:rRNA maturation endonuclease Nob1
MTNIEKALAWWRTLGNKEKDELQRDCGFNKNYIALTDREIKNIWLLRSPEKKNVVYENWMCKSVNLICSCNGCNRIIYEGEKWLEGGYCEECGDEIESENEGLKLKELPYII